MQGWVSKVQRVILVPLAFLGSGGDFHQRAQLVIMIKSYESAKNSNSEAGKTYKMANVDVFAAGFT